MMTTQPPTDPAAGAAMPGPQQETPEQLAERMAIVEAFADVVKEKRKQAIEGRRASGIEDIWAEDEEMYDGIDDANRATTSRTGSRMVKGSSTTDRPREVAKGGATRSTVFLKITRPYVDAAAARVSDMLLPTDDRNFALKPTPNPELTAMLRDMRPAGQDGQPMAPGAVPPAAPQSQQQPGIGTRIAGMFGFGAGAPSAPPQPQRTVAQAVQETLDKAKQAAERAQTQIDDWLTECHYHGEARLVIKGAAKVGVGILKGPIPASVRKRAAKQGPEGWSVEMREDIKPQSKAVNHWNFYPDPNCGPSIQRGSFVFEADDITGRGLRELKRSPLYIKEMIDLVLEEGPSSAVDGTRKYKEGDERPDADGDLYQIWYFHGLVSRKDMEAAGCRCGGDRELYPASVTMVNDRVIKASLSHLDSGEFPYDVMVWQARTDHWVGVGVARQMRECQKGANAAVRNLMDNAGLSAGPQIVVDRTKIIPANQSWELAPRKVWYSNTGEDGTTMDDVNKAFTIVNIDTRQVELMNTLQMWTQKAEEVTGLPMLMQGQMGEAARTDKVGIANIMNNNGSTVLRSLAKNFDDGITEPHIGRYYEYLLLFGKDDSAKGDFTVDARGSSALVERDLQNQEMVGIVQLSLQPAYGLDPEMVMREFLKSRRFDPKALELSEERKRELAQRQPPEDPRVTVAKMTLQAKEKSESADRELQEVLKGIDARLAMAELTSEERRHLETQRVALARVTMQLKTQADLAVGGAMVDVHKHRNPSPQVAPAAAEPPQRAPAGQAFIQ